MRLLLTAGLFALAGTASAEVSVERGDYLVRGPMGCGNCHTPLGPDGPVAGQELAGRLVEETPMYTAYAANLTPAGPIADWTDEELGRAIREGIRPDGTVIGPPMPIVLYRHISDDDLASIVAFLRTVSPVENEVPESTYNIPLPPAYGPPVESVSAPEPGVTEEWGGYVVTLAHCMECHSPMGEMGPMSDPAGGHMGQGGMEFHGPWGVSVGPNITPSEDGIASYSDDELKAMITQGVRPDGTPMLPPMPYPYLARMTPEDLDAVVLYLRSIPPLPSGG
ncbi:c-type cytochrome [Wenxinia marina]|uniref:Cytochrome c n=1 Tax=Wenxinia marina DSM 24838 TaxID=1123501 RepID=A0A0D0P7A0_9RHOB|nr:c-type cytochrome [Wenxinia marina]KIQ67466.1 Cytochrome c [Wenxinia marina DSM 24838]GGL69314.1 cytochrome c [Wenxinia marina]